MVYDFGEFTVETLVTGKWKENCYILADRESAELAIIDPGDDAKAIAKRLKAAGGQVRHILLTHGHMDHIGGLAYWCSQRRFQGMGAGTIVCDTRIEEAVHRMMAGFVDLEQQRTNYEVITLGNDEQVEIKNNIFLRAFHTEHTCPSIGYTIIEKRSKLRDEFLGLPQEKLRELKERGVEITRTLEIPLIAYIGDTLPGAHLLRFACSHHVGPDLFGKIAFGAALDAGRRVQLMGALGAPADHPISLDHPEGRYLSGLWLRRTD